MKVLYSLLLICVPFFAVAQIDYWQGGLFVGGAAFTGDINPQSTPDPSEVSLSIGLVGRVDVTPKIGFRGGLIYGHLTGDDLNYLSRENRGFRFNTTLIEFTGVMEWEPFASNRYYTNARGNIEMDKLVSPYLFIGVGMGFASLDTDFSRYEGNNAVLEQGIQQDRAQGSSQTAFIVPIGFGLKFDISNKVSLGLEFGGRLAFSDYLDGISQSANPDNNDGYFIAGLNSYYRFFN